MKKKLGNFVVRKVGNSIALMIPSRLELNLDNDLN